MKRHNFNVDFDKDVLQNDAELMESIDFLCINLLKIIGSIK